MGFCPQCGTRNTDDSMFCASCGTRLPQQQAAPSYEQPRQAAPSYEQPQYQAQPQYQQPQYQQAPYGAPAARRPLASDPIRDNAKRRFASGLFIALVSVYSAYALFSLIGAFLSAESLYQLTYVFRELTGTRLPGDVTDFLEGAGFLVVLINIIALTPVALLTAGGWMQFASAQRYDDARVSGLRLARVGVLIQMIFYCISAAFLLVVMILCISALGSMRGLGGAIALIIFLFLLMIGVIVYEIFFVLRLRTYMDGAARSIATGTAFPPAPKFVAVSAFILGGLGFIGAFTTMGLGIFTGLLHAASLILLGVICLKK